MRYDTFASLCSCWSVKHIVHILFIFMLPFYISVKIPFGLSILKVVSAFCIFFLRSLVHPLGLLELGRRMGERDVSVVIKKFEKVGGLCK